jgi:hypothetical protein
MALQESPAMIKLYEIYTASPDSIGRHLARDVSATGANDPLIVATGTDLVIFPGGGRDPVTQSFRVSTRGFKELAGISHLGPALASLVRMRELDPTSGQWKEDAHRLLAQLAEVRAANTVELWRDTIAVEAYRGFEPAITEMVNYACVVTSRFLQSVLDDESRLNAETLRREYLDARDVPGTPVPFNMVMIATFFLTNLDIAYRVLRWSQQQQLAWERTMVLISGKQGRPTAGVTWTTNSVCQMLLGASGDKLPLERILIAPHAPSFVLNELAGIEALRSLEQTYRSIWFSIQATRDLADPMFHEYARFQPQTGLAPSVTTSTLTVSELPAIRSNDDWLSLVTRLRVVLEDPRQLLSNCVADYAVAQLRAQGNRPDQVSIPGLSGVSYAIG